MFSFSKRDCASLIFIAFAGIILFFWGLGDSGVIDETPAKFAATGRLMSVSGNWLTPISNGIPRFDKPPLIYWLMAREILRMKGELPTDGELEETIDDYEAPLI